MARGITVEDVWQAADELLLEGQRPTIERVRQKIGRGSPNTVSPHLDAWFGRLGDRLAPPSPVRLAIPEQGDAPEAWMVSAQQLWAEARVLATQQVRAEIEAEIAGQRHELSAKAVELDDRQRDLDAAETELNARAEGFRQTLGLAEQQLSELRLERERLLLRLDSLQLERNRLDEALQTLVQQSTQERAQQQARSIEQERYWQMEVERSRERSRGQAQALELAQQELGRLRAEQLELRRIDEAEINRLQQALSRAEGALAAQHQLEQRQERGPVQRLKQRRIGLKRL